MPKFVKIIIYLVLFFAFLPSSFAQKIIIGVVRDVESKQPLARATVQIEGTNVGTITNADGRFQLKIDTFPSILTVRFLGYETQVRTLNQQDSQSQNFNLQSVSLESAAVEITGQDPAERIMRKVIDAKQIWKDDIKTYSTEVFSRFVLYARDPEFVSAPEHITQIVETNADAFWKQLQGNRELVRAKRVLPLRSGVFRFASVEAVPNFYGDEVWIRGKSLKGVTNPQALDDYAFRIGDRRPSADGETIYDIYCTPKRDDEHGLIGRITVRTNDYAMLESEMRPAIWLKEDQVRERQATYLQRFQNYGGKGWIPIDLLMEGKVTFGSRAADQPPARYTQISRLTRFRLNEAVPDSLYEKPEVLQVEEGALDRGEMLRYLSDLIPMTVEESKAVLQGLSGLSAAYHPRGLALGGTAALTDKPKKPNVIKDDLLRAIRYNRVEGFRLGASHTFAVPKRSKTQELRADVGYSVAQRKPDAMAAFRIKSPKQSKYIEAGGRFGVASRYNSTIYPLLINSVATYLGFDDYYDYFKEQKAWVEGGMFIRKNKISGTYKGLFTLNLQYKNDATLTKASNHVGKITGRAQRSNPPILDGHFVSAKVGLQVGDVTPLWNWRGYNGGKFSATYAPKDVLGNTAGFAQFNADWFGSVRTLFRNQDHENHFNYRIAAAHSMGELPAQRFTALDMNLAGYINPFGTFKTYAREPFEGSSHLGAFWEYDFSTAIFKFIRFSDWEKRGNSIAIFGNHGRTWLSDEAKNRLKYSPNVTPDWIHEAGVALTLHPLNVPMRLEFTRRLDASKWYIGLGILTKF
jgi:hypothetical protein